MKLDKKQLLLYAVTDRKWLNGRRLSEDIEASLQGGITLLQLREKELKNDDFFNEAIEIKKLCKAYNVPFIVNDNVEIAIKSDADGIHIGQQDMPIDEVRKLIGENKILGVSAQTVEQALLAEKMGADYLGVGAVFSTKSKSDAINVEITTLKQICKQVKIPVVAIGGITAENIPLLAKTGIAGIATISAIYGEKEIKEATYKLKNIVQQTLKEN
ncbi:thiamine phosphate synthase [Mergibacter septicus]|uniref:Thiamine-phosphate synthase n=1 Tax=Mergibacter septicus TaxID=221402 RepID=A0A8D4J0J8_9PAST|nr:thiamine phosphate synthase [Mergibacter septicus]AWX15754.1 thiamine phosphate synthase [Mergibacter septicus]QDJ15007.1 thiamine phosphate synthase [Mergibacter septicus]UTU47568.1 thiamine phosphate synthase [Mergibacter septicus]WMR95251.1 thiamine phosphate synthase [Mergibacter septicus]